MIGIRSMMSRISYDLRRDAASDSATRSQPLDSSRLAKHEPEGRIRTAGEE